MYFLTPISELIIGLDFVFDNWNNIGNSTVIIQDLPLLCVMTSLFCNPKEKYQAQSLSSRPDSMADCTQTFKS